MRCLCLIPALIKSQHKTATLNVHSVWLPKPGLQGILFLSTQYAQDLGEKKKSHNTLTVWVQMAFPGEYSINSVEGDGLRNG